METHRVLGGLALIDVDDPNEALRIAAGHRMARAGSIRLHPFWNTL